MLSIGGRDFPEFARRARIVDKKILTGLRKQVKILGSGMVGAAKDAILQPPYGDNPDVSAGSREKVAAGMRTQLSLGKNTAGVRIIAAPNRLDAKHRGFLAAYNTSSIRHPVFGNRAVFVTQPGRPYFGSVIAKHLRKNDVKQMLHVIDDAFKSVGAR